MKLYFSDTPLELCKEKDISEAFFQLIPPRVFNPLRACSNTGIIVIDFASFLLRTRGIFTRVLCRPINLFPKEGLTKEPLCVAFKYGSGLL